MSFIKNILIVLVLAYLGIWVVYMVSDAAGGAVLTPEIDRLIKPWLP